MKSISQETFPQIGEHTSTLELWEGKFQFHHQVYSYELACSRVEPFHFPSICRPRMGGVLLSIQKGYLAKATPTSENIVTINQINNVFHGLGAPQIINCRFHHHLNQPRSNNMKQFVSCLLSCRQ